MSNVINKVTEVATLGLVDDVTGSEAAQDAAGRAAGTVASGQREALEYLKSREALPQQLREEALTRSASLYGMGEGDPAETMEGLKRSPIYEAIMGTRAAGEEGIERRAGQAGMTRSGNAADDIYSYNANLENEALMRSLQGMQGFANLPSNANQIAAGTAGIGRTLGQGIAAQGQAEQASTGMWLNAITGGAKAFI